MGIVALLIDILFMAMDIFVWIMIVAIIMSWLFAFNVLNSNNKFVRDLYAFLNRIIEPVLRPIRKVIPPIGGIDITPIVVIFGFQFLKQIIVRLLFI